MSNKTKKLRVVEINTTAYHEENLTIITTLSDDEISEVLQPIIDKERDGGEDDEYDNDVLVKALIVAYPKHTVVHSEENDYLEL